MLAAFQGFYGFFKTKDVLWILFPGPTIDLCAFHSRVYAFGALASTAGFMSFGFWKFLVFHALAPGGKMSKASF